MRGTSEELLKLAKSGTLSAFKKRLADRHALRTWQDGLGNFLVHHAVKGMNFDVVAYLLDKGVSVVTPGEKGATPLHYAAAGGNLNMLRLLLRADSMVMPINQNGMTPLHVAAGEGHLDAVRFLVSRGGRADYRARLGRLAIHFAAGANHVGIVRFFKDLDPAFLEAPDEFKMRPLHWSCYFGACSTASWLLEQEVAVNVSDVYGRLPGTFACNATCPRLEKVTKSLPGWGLRVKYSSLHEAVLAGTQDELHRLLDRAESRTQGDAFGRTPLHLAALTGNRLIFDALREFGAPTRQRDDYGWTPLKLLSYCMKHQKGNDDTN